MLIASFNVENMFDRAKALNAATWAEGKPALEAHKALNALFEKAVYSSADKAGMLDLLKASGLLKSDEGPLMRLRKIRGQLLKRPRAGAPEIVASGRTSWIGWVELKTGPVNEVATQNTARVIASVNADIVGVMEAEDRTTLRLFNEQVLGETSIEHLLFNAYHHVMLVDGNDDRGIDVGLLTRRDYPVLSIRSHVHDADAQGLIFSRDCAEYQIGLPSGRQLWVLLNHFKSKGYGEQAANDAKRKRQATRVREICDAHFAEGDDWLVMMGDLNEVPGNDPLSPLLREGSTLRDVASHALYHDGGRPGTHGNCTAAGKFDYILLSPALFGKVTAAGVERRGMWGGTKGSLWPHFKELTRAEEAASDHAAVWVTLDI
jgi:endonuclease/exonuclease/phosphatase family metal-dependent hydrolase